MAKQGRGAPRGGGGGGGLVGKRRLGERDPNAWGADADLPLATRFGRSVLGGDAIQCRAFFCTSASPFTSPESIGSQLLCTPPPPPPQEKLIAVRLKGREGQWRHERKWRRGPESSASHLLPVGVDFGGDALESRQLSHAPPSPVADGHMPTQEKLTAGCGAGGVRPWEIPGKHWHVMSRTRPF